MRFTWQHLGADSVLMQIEVRLTFNGFFRLPVVCTCFKILVWSVISVILQDCHVLKYRYQNVNKLRFKNKKNKGFPPEIQLVCAFHSKVCRKCLYANCRVIAVVVTFSTDSILKN